MTLALSAALLLLSGVYAVSKSDSPSAPVLVLANAQPTVQRTSPALRIADEATTSRPASNQTFASSSPEAQLIGIYRLIADQRMADALAAAEELARQFPTFKLAQLVYGDLLAARVAPLPAFGGQHTKSSQVNPATELAVLRDEARQRIKALQERPPEGAVPDEFVQLPLSTRYAIAVDTSRSRLYLFENFPSGLKLINDYYVSVGKQGVDKLVEGDQRTPLGVYFITDRIDPRALEDRFGAGALPLNYPNAYDKFRGRTGSGILVHGVPSNTYSRPPLDSDGCIALSNEDLIRLANQLPQRDTPVVITRQVRWVKAEQSSASRQAFLDKVKLWQDARLRADRQTLESLYASTQSTSATALDNTKAKQRLSQPVTAIDNVSVLTWHDDKNKMVVTFRELSGSGKRERERVMRQYWRRAEADEWRILAEGPVR
ncbi:MAG: L,D-transpeptidase [Ideonella sp.]|nr:L,D-transpeptidase [Ideonella sp.]